MNNFLNKYYLPILLFIIFCFYFFNRNYFFDDSLIYARYIKNVLEGKGLVYNEGEKYNGLTSPLFVYLNIIFCYFFSINNIIFIINFTSYIFLTLTVIVLNLISKKYIQPIYNVFVSLLILVTSSLIYNSLGMETYLFTFLLVTSIYLFIINKYFFLLIALTLLILTRAEGSFLILALLIEHIILKRKFPDLKYFIVPIILLSIHYGFNYFYFGKMLPDSASAKILHAKSGFWSKSRIDFIKNGLPILWQNKFIFFITISIFSLGIYKLKNSTINRLLLLFLFFYTFFYTFLKIPSYFWYYIPIYILLSIYFASGLSFIFNILEKKNIVLSYIIITVIAFPLLVNNIKSLKFADCSTLNLKLSEREIEYKKIGIWLNENTPKNASIGMIEIGVIGYYSERKIIDFCGLISPTNAKYIANKDTHSWILTYKPDYVLIHKPYWTPLENVVETLFFKSNYEKVSTFHLQNYNLFKRRDIYWVN